MTLLEALIIALVIFSSNTPNSLLAFAEESLICANAFMKDLLNLCLLIGKFNSALLVFAP